MIDVQKAVRYGFGKALENQLSYQGTAVPITDSILTIDDSCNLYVVITLQTAKESSDFSKFRYNATITLDIVHKAGYAVSKDAVDSIAEQISSIIQPTVTSNGLVAQTGIKFTNVNRVSDSYLSLSLNNIGPVVRRIIVYEVLVHQN